MPVDMRTFRLDTGDWIKAGDTVRATVYGAPALGQVVALFHMNMGPGDDRWARIAIAGEPAPLVVRVSNVHGHAPNSGTAVLG